MAPLPTVPLKAKSKKRRVVDAALAHINANNPQRPARAAIESAARGVTGLTQAQVDASLLQAYDDAAALGLVPPRA